MKVKNITNSIEIIKKEELDTLFRSYERTSGLICKGVTCLDLSNLSNFSSENNLTGASFLIVYHFHNLDKEKRFHIGVSLLYGQTIQSYSYIWPSLFYFENEIQKLYGITIYRHERIQKEIVEKSQASFMEKSYDGRDKISVETESQFEKGIDVVNLNLTEYGIRSQRANFDMAVHGKKIVGLKASQEGVFLGLEKLFEKINIEHIRKYISHVNGYSFIPYQILWSETLEKSQGFEIGDYENTKRMLLYEFSKVIENFRYLSLSFKVIDEVDSHLKCREFLNQFKLLLLDFGTARPHPLVVSPCSETILPEGWKRKCSLLIKSFTKDFDKLKSNITRLSRVLELSHIRSARMNALKCGYTGLPLRSFGVSHDLRKNDKFYLYDELELNVPLGINGTSYDRILIRLEEVQESFSNIIRIIESFPIAEGLREADSFSPPANDQIYYSYCETSSGEVNFLTALRKDSTKVDRLHIMTPTLRTLKIFEESYHSSDLDLMVVDWVSLGMNMEEVSK